MGNLFSKQYEDLIELNLHEEITILRREIETLKNRIRVLESNNIPSPEYIWDEL